MTKDHDPEAPKTTLDALTGPGGILEAIGLVVAPSSVITALLYFFGWVRTGAYFAYFGLDRSVLRLSTQDYLLRTPELALRPGVFVLLIAVLLVAIRRLFLRLGRATFGRRLAWLVTGAVWATAGTFMTIGGVGLFAPAWGIRPLASGLSLGIGSLIAVIWLRAMEGMQQRPEPATRRSRVTLVQVSLIATAILAAFWAESVYAQQAGARLAEYTALVPSSRPATVIYSHDRLQIYGPGVQVASIGTTDSAYRFRYSGMRLLLFADDRWILIPEGWRRTNGATVVILSNSSSLRVEFQPPSN
jgi:hypothetical protein